MAPYLIWAPDSFGPPKIWSPRNLVPYNLRSPKAWYLHKNAIYDFHTETKFPRDQKSQGTKHDQGSFKLWLKQSFVIWWPN